jgi:hypothetical protein
VQWNQILCFLRGCLKSWKVQNQEKLEWCNVKTIWFSLYLNFGRLFKKKKYMLELVTMYVEVRIWFSVSGYYPSIPRSTGKYSTCLVILFLWLLNKSSVFFISELTVCVIYFQLLCTLQQYYSWYQIDMCFPVASIPLSISENVALCFATSFFSSGSSGLLRCWSAHYRLQIPHNHCHMLCSLQTALRDIVNCTHSSSLSSLSFSALSSLLLTWSVKKQCSTEQFLIAPHVEVG